MLIQHLLYHQLLHGSMLTPTISCLNQPSHPVSKFKPKHFVPGILERWEVKGSEYIWREWKEHFMSDITKTWELEKTQRWICPKHTKKRRTEEVEYKNLVQVWDIEKESFVETPSKTRSGTVRFWESQAVTLQTLSLLRQQVCSETASCVWSSILARRVTHTLH